MHEQTAPSLIATFATREAAHGALQKLHEEGFHDTWLGIMKASENGYGDSASANAEPVVESDNAVARFFGGGDQSLHDALLRHGLSEADAQRIDGTLPIGSAILTVHGSNHPELAAQVVATNGGTILDSTGSSALYDRYADDAKSKMDANKLQTFGTYNGGKEIDQPQILKLREERLTIDKNREKSGEATVSKKVTSEAVAIDVPVYHEELFIERRAATGSYGDVGSIGDGETIVVPLERETVQVGKQTVVTEEVAIGQRRVDGVEHVSETVRKEALDVDRTGSSDLR